MRYLYSVKRRSLVPWQVPFTSYLNDWVVTQLKKRYPFIEVANIGYSVMGKALPSLVIGEGKTKVFYAASFHANESITTPVLLKFAEEYAQAYSVGGKIFFDINGAGMYVDREETSGGEVSAEELYRKIQLYIVPMVNPDGVDLVNGFLTDGPYYEKARQIAANYPWIPFPKGWKANVDGVDLNLQFPAGWKNAREIKYEQGYTSPAPRDYVGEMPLCAPEVKAVYDFTLEHDFSLILAYHTQGRVIYWRYLDYEPKDSYQIARYFGEVSGYAVEETPLASGYAGYKDWFVQEYNRPGYTIEAGEGENPLPPEAFARIYADNKGILLGGMTKIGEQERKDFGKKE